MGKTVPMVVYKDEERIVLGEVEVQGDFISAELQVVEGTVTFGKEGRPVTVMKKQNVFDNE